MTLIKIVCKYEIAAKTKRILIYYGNYIQYRENAGSMSALYDGWKACSTPFVTKPIH